MTDTTMHPKHIVIANGSLCSSRGGTERVVSNLSAALVERGYRVTVISFAMKSKTTPVYPLDERVKFILVNYRGKQSDINALRAYLLRENVDVFLALESGGYFLYWSVLCKGSGIPLICSERCDPLIYIENIVWHRAGRYAALSSADIIHELLPSFVDSIPQHWQDKVQVIPNTLPSKFEPAKAEGFAGKRKKLLYLARLDKQKNPHIMLEAFCLLADKYPEWDLEIWGHGTLEKAIAKQIKKSGISDRIFLRGKCIDTVKAYAEAQLYCLPSAYEGFPNSVLEAMSAGLPVVGFQTCTAMNDVIIEEKTGLLAPIANAHSLSECLARLMADDDLRKEMGEAAFSFVMEKYNPDKIYAAWEELLVHAFKSKGNTVLDRFTDAPFIYQARLLSAARAEYLFRRFGTPMPYSFPWWWQKMGFFAKNLWQYIKKNSNDRIFMNAFKNFILENYYRIHNILLPDVLTSAERKILSEKSKRAKEIDKYSHDDLKKAITKQFKEYLTCDVNLENPKTFQDKMAWLKLYYQSPIMTVCADKFHSINYVKSKTNLSDAFLVKHLSSYNSASEIDLNTLPDKFILKSNWGSGAQYIVEDKCKASFDKIKHCARLWLASCSNHYYSAFEYSYKNIKGKVICEELLDFEYKLEIHCFNGKPKFIWTVFDDKTQNTSADFRDLEWNIMPLAHKYPNTTRNIEKPSCLDEILDLATKLSADFPFVRIDFYKTKDSYKFSELTFFPWAGLYHFTPIEYDEIFGELLILPENKIIEK